VTREGEPWFVLADVCKVLDYSDSAQAARNLDSDEIHTLHNTQGITESRNGIVKLINESGLYSLVLTSRKPDAKRFKKWITSEVIPSIRKTGGYGVQAPAIDLNDPAFLRGALLTYTEKVIALESQITILAPKAEALDLSETHRVASRLDDDEKDRHAMTTPGGEQKVTIINESGLYSLGVIINDPHGRPQNTTIISEYGLYSLVLASRKPDARLDDDEKADVGITDTSQNGGKLKPDEKGVISLRDSIGRMQDATVITEAGFYRLVLRSDKPAAARLDDEEKGVVTTDTPG
jgi:prophage antirepressor-like protein